MIVVLFMCLSLLLVTGIGIDSGPSLAALLFSPLPLSAFFLHPIGPLQDSLVPHVQRRIATIPIPAWNCHNA